MKKMLSIGLAMMLAFTTLNFTSIYASDDFSQMLSEESKNEETELLKKVDELGLTILSDEEAQKLGLSTSKIDIVNIEDLESIAENIEDNPEINLDDKIVEVKPTIRGTTGNKTQYLDITGVNNLITRHSATGNFATDTKGKLYWTKAVTSTITELKNSGYTRLSKINSTSVSINPNDKTCLIQSCDYITDSYLGIPINNKITFVKVGSQTVNKKFIFI